MMVNAVILGHIKIDKEFCDKEENAGHYECIDSIQYQAAFGLASSTVSIIFLATGICFTLGLG